MQLDPLASQAANRCQIGENYGLSRQVAADVHTPGGAPGPKHRVRGRAWPAWSRQHQVRRACAYPRSRTLSGACSRSPFAAWLRVTARATALPA